MGIMAALHVPLADVQRLARHLQFEKTDYGDVISLQQIRTAERIIRRLVREHLRGDWDRLNKQKRVSAC